MWMQWWRTISNDWTPIKIKLNIIYLIINNNYNSMKNNELLYEDLDYDQDDQEYNDQDEED